MQDYSNINIQLSTANADGNTVLSRTEAENWLIDAGYQVNDNHLNYIFSESENVTIDDFIQSTEELSINNYFTQLGITDLSAVTNEQFFQYEILSNGTFNNSLSTFELGNVFPSNTPTTSNPFDTPTPTPPTTSNPTDPMAALGLNLDPEIIDMFTTVLSFFGFDIPAGLSTGQEFISFMGGILSSFGINIDDLFSPSMPTSTPMPTSQPAGTLNVSNVNEAGSLDDIDAELEALKRTFDPLFEGQDTIDIDDGKGGTVSVNKAQFYEHLRDSLEYFKEYEGEDGYDYYNRGDFVKRLAAIGGDESSLESSDLLHILNRDGSIDNESAWFFGVGYTGSNAINGDSLRQYYVNAASDSDDYEYFPLTSVASEDHQQEKKGKKKKKKGKKKDKNNDQNNQNNGVMNIARNVSSPTSSSNTQQNKNVESNYQNGGIAFRDVEIEYGDIQYDGQEVIIESSLPSTIKFRYGDGATAQDAVKIQQLVEKMYNADPDFRAFADAIIKWHGHWTIGVVDLENPRSRAAVHNLSDDQYGWESMMWIDTEVVRSETADGIAQIEGNLQPSGSEQRVVGTIIHEGLHLLGYEHDKITRGDVTLDGIEDLQDEDWGSDNVFYNLANGTDDGYSLETFYFDTPAMIESMRRIFPAISGSSDATTSGTSETKFEADPLEIARQNCPRCAAKQNKS